MGTKRKKYSFRGGEIIEIEDYHDGKYGAPGKKRKAKKKLTEEQMREINARNKAKRCRHRLLEYFTQGDIWATWTYRVPERPEDMKTALKDFQDAMRIVRREYKKRGQELRWIRNIERGTKGAWHIHLVINEIGDTASIITKAWKKGGTWLTEIRNSKFAEEDFSQLANYLTKDEHTREKKKDGSESKPRLSDANYRCSRNMPFPEPKTRVLKHWKTEIKPWKGYYIAKQYEGISPLGFRYRSYTMIKLDRRI